MDTLDIAIISVFLLVVTIYFNRPLLNELLFSNDDSFKLSNNSGSRDILTVLKENNKNFLVLYGSQTGTAEDYAKKFSKELVSKFKLNVMCADLEDYDYDSLNQLPDNIVISFFMSTYGEGEFPDNALQFENYLNSLDSTCEFENLNYTMFGLGNSTYEHFNGASRRASKLLKQLGASEIGKFGMADDGAGTTDEDYISWKDSILEDIKSYLHLDEQDIKFEPSFKLTKLDSIDDHVFLGEPSKQYLPLNKLPFSQEKNVQTGPFDITYPYIAPIVKSRELFGHENDRNCIHSEFDISGSNLKYSTGDHLAIWPSNANEKIKKFLHVFNLNGDEIFTLEPSDPTMKLPFPCPTTIETAVRHYLEITGPVSRQFLGSLVQFAPSLEIKEKLLEFSKDKDLFAIEITSKYYDIADALLQLSSGKQWSFVPWDFLIESVGKLQPRYYSISSSSLSEKQTIHITSIVENTPNDVSGNPPVVGVTTNLLRNIQLSKNNGSENNNLLPVHYDLDGPRNLYHDFKLPIHVRKSQFRLPSNPQTPIIMVGPGTGVAPFRGFIRERVKFMELNENVKLGKHLLFYGSRNESDFLYRDEWVEYANKLGDSFKMVVAHSRIPGQKKQYVQFKLKDMEDEVLKLLKEGAFIYVCGDAKGMARDVHETFANIIRRGMNISEDEALDMLKMFKSSGKYQEDVW